MTIKPIGDGIRSHIHISVVEIEGKNPGLGAVAEHKSTIRMATIESAERPWGHRGYGVTSRWMDADVTFCFVNI